MARNQDSPVIITAGRYLHIRQFHAYHRNYSEVRGVGLTRAEALDHLTQQLDGCLAFSAGREGRDLVERALADVRSVRRRVARGQAASTPRPHARA